MWHPVGMDNDDPLARWQSWLDKDHMPEDWRRNLWDEF